MNALILTLFTSIFFLDYLSSKLNLLPRVFTWIPEILSIIALLIIHVYFVLSKRIWIDNKYLILFSLLALDVLSGVVLQSVAPGTFIAGFRKYFKFLPFFFIPCIYNFSDRQIGVQLWFLLFLVLIQSPLAVFQRFVQFASSMHTGDPVTGTLTTSGTLSLIMICAMALIMSFYCYRKLKMSTLIILLTVLLLPTTLNETKVSFFLIPIALVMPLIFGAEPGTRLRMVVPVAALTMVAMVVFVLIYDHLIQNRVLLDYGTYERGEPILEFLTSGKVEKYLYSGKDLDKMTYVTRLDSVIIPIRILSDDWLQITIGLGVGNVSESFLAGMSGEYWLKYGRFLGVTAMGDLIWELGIVGMVLYVVFFYLVFRDALKLRRMEGLVGVLGSWWSVVMIIMTLSLIYVTTFHVNEIGYLLWYFSGYIASARYRSRIGHLQVQAQGNRVMKTDHLIIRPIPQAIKQD
jgi:hypothetical protein